jgi:uncharacterized cysteine cluster protein YcgN (CxxCxxCC family)
MSLESIPKSDCEGCEHCPTFKTIDIGGYKTTLVECSLVDQSTIYLQNKDNFVKCHNFKVKEDEHG